jgi:hypothetical protein
MVPPIGAGLRMPRVIAFITVKRSAPVRLVDYHLTGEDLPAEIDIEGDVLRFVEEQAEVDTAVLAEPCLSAAHCGASKASTSVSRMRHHPANAADANWSAVVVPIAQIDPAADTSWSSS